MVGCWPADIITFNLFLLMVPGAAIVCIVHKWTTQLAGVELDEMYDEADETASLKVAFRRYLQARETAADRSLLFTYIKQLEDDVQSSFHVFISYRVAPEKEFAKALFDALSECTIQSTRQKLRVYLDQVRLEDGERWDNGFMEGLGNSWIACPILSTDGLMPMKNLNPANGKDSSQTDNVLLEWIAALELFERGAIKAIIPLIVPSVGTMAEFAWGLPHELSLREHKTTTTAAKKHLRNHRTSDSIDDEQLLDGAARIVASVTNGADTQGEVTVSGVVSAILRFQGVKMNDRTDMQQATDRIKAKVEKILSANDVKAMAVQENAEME